MSKRRSRIDTWRGNSVGDAVFAIPPGERDKTLCDVVHMNQHGDLQLCVRRTRKFFWLSPDGFYLFQRNRNVGANR